MKKIGFLSFGHWTPSPHSQARTAPPRRGVPASARGKRVRQTQPPADVPRPGLLRLEPYSEGLLERIWWGSSSNATSVWAAKLGMNLQSSTLKDDESGEPLHVQQRKQIEACRAAWKEAGHQREPRVSVSRSIFLKYVAPDLGWR